MTLPPDPALSAPAAAAALRSQPAAGASARPASAGVAVATALLLLPRLWEPLGRDQAVFALVGRLWWADRWPYRDVFEHKPPGLLAAYALVAPLGDAGPALLDVGAAALTAALLVHLLWPLGRAPAILAGLIYAVCARHPVFGGFWAIAQPEPLQECAVALAAWAGVQRRWFAAGVALFAALALKFTLVLAVAVAVAAAWPRRRALLSLALGLAAPALALVAALAAAGALEPAWQVAIRFNLHHAAATSLPWAAVPAAAFASCSRLAMGFAGVPLLALYAVGAEAVARSPQRRAVALAVAAGATALAQALVQAKLWAWHWQAAVLPLAALAGLGLARLPQRWRLAVGGAALISALPGWGAYWTRHPLPALVHGDLSRAQWLQTYHWGRGDWSAVEEAATAAWLRQQARPGDRLLVWGFEPGLYWHSQLPPATRWIYDYPLTVALPPAERSAGLAEIAASLPQTRWWVVMTGDANALERQPSDRQLADAPALTQALQRDYRLAQVIGDAYIYQRIQP